METIMSMFNHMDDDMDLDWIGSELKTKNDVLY